MGSIIYFGFGYIGEFILNFSISLFCIPFGIFFLIIIILRDFNCGSFYFSSMLTTYLFPLKQKKHARFSSIGML
jgi:hypothetical protein